MKRFAATALLLVMCASPALALKHHQAKDPRVTPHPRAVHPQNPNFKHRTKHVVNKHHA
jgi:hypothetical protein